MTGSANATISKKDTALEALRGIAALTVVFVHNRNAFLSPENPFPRLPQVFEIFFAGGAAVLFFFVLSGYVLTRKFIEIESNYYLIRSIAKRYFRLLGLCLLSFLLSAALFRMGAYHYLEVSVLVKSVWLSMFGYSIPSDIIFKPSFLDAFKQGAFEVFFMPERHYYNSPLGTMYYEMIGSFIVFGMAFCAVIFRRFSDVLMWGFWLISLVISFYFSTFYAAFICGLGLTLMFSQRKIRLSHRLSWILIIIAVILLSFVAPTHEYAVFAKFGMTQDSAPRVWLVGSILLILGVEMNHRVKATLSGRLGAFLGRLSFPIYVIHFLVLASLGCFVWLHVEKSYGPTAAFFVSSIVSVTGAVLAALPLITFDTWWTKNVNRIAAILIKAPDNQFTPSDSPPR